MFQILPTGQKLTREIINNIPRFVLSMIRPGPGIRCFPTGDGGICIATDMVTAGQGRQSMGGGGGGGGTGVEVVTALPAIPDEGYKMVFWTSADGGTGDNQLWEVYAGQTAWTPCQNYTTLSGVPV